MIDSSTGKRRTHEYTVDRLRQIAEEHRQTINTIYDQARIAQSRRVRQVLKMMVPEALGRMGLADKLKERAELIKQLDELEREIKRWIGSADVDFDKAIEHAVSAQPHSGVKALETFLSKALSEEAMHVARERGWAEIITTTIGDMPIISDLEKFRRETHTAQQVKDMIEAETNRALAILAQFSNY